MTNPKASNLHILETEPGGHFDINDLFVKDVEKLLGVSVDHWSCCVEPGAVCAATIAVFMAYYEIKKH